MLNLIAFQQQLSDDTILSIEARQKIKGGTGEDDSTNVIGVDDIIDG